VKGGSQKGKMLNEEKSLPDRSSTPRLRLEEQAGVLGGFKYEITFIVPEEVTQEPVSKILGSAGAKVVNVKEIGVKSFAYPIAKLNQGRYFCLKFEIEPELLVKLEKSLKTEKNVLRHLVVRELRVREPRPPKPEKKVSVGEKQPEGVKEIKPDAVKVEQKRAEATVVVGEKPVLKPHVKTPAATEEKVQEKPMQKETEEKPIAEKAPEGVGKPAEKPSFAKATEGSTALPEKPAKPVKKSNEPEISKDLLDAKLKDLVGDE
jgi:small subunit ribosomal protein S6